MCPTHSSGNIAEYCFKCLPFNHLFLDLKLAQIWKWLRKHSHLTVNFCQHNRWEVISRCSLNFIFLIMCRIQNIFMCLNTNFIPGSVNCVFIAFCPLFSIRLLYYSSHQTTKIIFKLEEVPFCNLCIKYIPLVCHLFLYFVYCLFPQYKPFKYI